MILRVLASLLLFIAVTIPASAAKKLWVELPQDQAIWDQTRTAFLAGDFDRFDAWADVYLASKSKTASGNWKLLIFYSTFEYPHFLYPDYDEATLARMAAQAQKWIDARPHSRAAKIVMGITIMDRAWFWRGPDPLPRIPLESWATYFKYKKQSFDYLTSVRDEASGDPHWYAAMLSAMVPEGPTLGDPDAMIREAIRKFADYNGIYEPIVLINQPKFGAGQQTLDDLIQRTADAVGGEQGDIAYARMYWSVAERISRYKTFFETKASWARIDAGFTALAQRYPTERYRNAHALLACLANDKRRMKELTPAVMASQPLWDVWLDDDMARACLAYADMPY
jgi:hypothetical protein